VSATHDGALPARVLVRTDVDYLSMDARAFAAQSDPMRPLMFVRSAVSDGSLEVFHEVFGVDFFALRAAMKARAQAELRALRGANVSMGFSDFDEWFSRPGDEVIFPTDDDDLFHPEMLTIARVPRNATFVVWEYTGIGFHPWSRHAGVHRLQLPTLLSNNWGVKKSFLQATLSASEARRFLAHHAEAQELMIRHLGLRRASGWMGGFASMLTELRHPTVHFVTEPLSIQYLYPASLYYLVMTSRVANLRNQLLELDFETPIRLPEPLAWARPSVDRFESLMRRLAEGRAARSGAGSHERSAP
jgi:hypothetical protein